MDRIRRFLSYDRSIASFTDANGKKMSLIGLSIPILMQSLLTNLMSTVNTFILSHYSESAAAATATATQLVNMISLFYSLISAGVNILVVQNVGAGRMEEAGKAASLSVSFCAGASLLIGITMSVFARSMMQMMGLEGELLEEATQYFRVVSMFNVISTTITVFSNITRAYGKTVYGLICGILMNALNALFNYIVIFRPFETPLSGITGVAISRTAAEVIALTVNIILVLRLGVKLSLKAALKPSREMLKTVLKYGIPSSIVPLSWSISQLVSTMIMAKVGSTALIAKSFVNSFLNYVTILSASMGSATALLIGWYIGKNEMDKAYRLNLQNIKIAVLINIVLSLVFLVIGEPILRTLTSNEEIISIGKNVVFVNLFVAVGKAMNNIEDNALRAAGDVVYQLVVGLISCWVVAVFFCYLFGVVFGWGLVGCWISFALDELTRGFAYLFRWLSKKWMSKRAIK